MAEMDAEIDAALAEDEAGDNSDDDEDAALPDRLLASPSSSSSERGALLITALSHYSTLSMISGFPPALPHGSAASILSLAPWSHGDVLAPSGVAGGAEARIGTSYTGHSDMASSSSDDDSDDGGFSSRYSKRIISAPRERSFVCVTSCTLHHVQYLVT